MKMVKSLLLGSAAGLVAVTAGQAADLPVKAKPVEYVKVCSLYGAGFYYMPGTDMCIKIGGWVRAEVEEGGNGSLQWGPYLANSQQRSSSNFTVRARGYITADAREQTAYGTARGYIAVGLSTNSVALDGQANQFSANRAFVQFAGMTAGITQSFYDYFSAAAIALRGGFFPASDTGDPGWWVWAYTAQLGNGVSATISAEARRTTQIIDGNCVGNNSATAAPVPTCGVAAGGFAAAANIGGSALEGATGTFSPGNGAYGGWQAPDVVGNLRVDQTWGGAQIMGALHEDNASYYSSIASAGPSVLSGAHPGDTWGWAVGAGLRLNFPMIAAGDYFQSQVNYTQGALRYLFFTPNSNWSKNAGASEAYGVLSDCVYGGGPVAATGGETGCNLTTGWGLNASYEHYWTPQLHESFYGSYYAVRYNNQANNELCSGEGMGNGGSGAGALAAGSCNNNWSTWGVGSRLQWDVTKSFYLGLEVLYEDLTSATPNTGSGGALTAPVAVGSAAFQESQQSNWSISARMHKDFLP
jgi:hypothetical protein